jgi:hypothetical protein
MGRKRHWVGDAARAHEAALRFTPQAKLDDADGLLDADFDDYPSDMDLVEIFRRNSKLFAA